MLAVIAASVTAGCRRYPPPRSVPPANPGPTRTAEPEPRAEREAPADSFIISERAAAIIDSIEAAVRDSFARLRAEESAAIARQDSIRQAAIADSIARAAAVSDSLEAAAAAAQARQDSLEAAARADSIAAAARQDSLRQVAIEDSIAAARIAQAAVVPAGAAAAPADDAVQDLETLRALGPSYIPYDEGPETIWNTETQATLSKTLLPVLRAEGLPASTKTIFWVLISREGRAEDVEIQTSSGNEAFDEAAETFLRGLVFIPAIRANRPVASWVLREISMLMAQ